MSLVSSILSSTSSFYSLIFYSRSSSAVLWLIFVPLNHDSIHTPEPLITWRFRDRRTMVPPNFAVTPLVPLFACRRCDATKIAMRVGTQRPPFTASVVSQVLLSLLLKLQSSLCVQGWCSDAVACVHLLSSILHWNFIIQFCVVSTTMVCESLKSPTNFARFQLSWLFPQYSIRANALTCILS